MGTTCVDICDEIVSVICSKFPNYKICQSQEDEANHEQMADCIHQLTMKEYPEEKEIQLMEE